MSVCGNSQVMSKKPLGNIVYKRLTFNEGATMWIQ